MIYICGSNCIGYDDFDVYFVDASGFSEKDAELLISIHNNGSIIGTTEHGAIKFRNDLYEIISLVEYVLYQYPFKEKREEIEENILDVFRKLSDDGYMKFRNEQSKYTEVYWRESWETCLSIIDYDRKFVVTPT